jgi:hypothetical protein
MLWNGLICLSILVDHQMHLGMIDPQKAQADVRCDARTCNMREETEDPNSYLYLVGGEIRSLARPFEPMNDKAVSLNGEVPQLEADLLQLDTSAGGILQHIHNGFANSLVKVIRSRVPGERGHQDKQQDTESSKDPRNDMRDSSTKRALYLYKLLL